MGVNSLPKTVTRQPRGCNLNPDPTAPESSTLTTQLPRHPVRHVHAVYQIFAGLHGVHIDVATVVFCFHSTKYYQQQSNNNKMLTRYGDSGEENASIFSLIQMRWLPPARACRQ